MHRGAYWAANFLVDFLKVEFVVALTVTAFHFANLKYYTAWITFLLFPLGAIPFTYVISFWFETVSAAQTGVMFLNFGSILFGSTLIFYLRWIKEWEIVGDYAHFSMKILPPYLLGQSIYFDASMKDLVEFRLSTLGVGQDLYADPWRIETVSGDMTG